MTTMLAPSNKSSVQKQLSGIDAVENFEYCLGSNALFLLLWVRFLWLLPPEDAAAAAVLVDSCLE
jgi:hypothetical protein